MDIGTSVRLTAEEGEQLADILKCDIDALPARIGELGRAALREYVDMLLGISALRSPENREQRLLLLILEAYGGEVPDQSKISLLFNLTRSAAASLSRSVLSRYRILLAQPVREAAIRALRLCGPEDELGYRRVSLRNPAIVDHLNQLLVEHDGALKLISRESRTGANYLIPPDSYLELRRVLQW